MYNTGMIRPLFHVQVTLQGIDDEKATNALCHFAVPVGATGTWELAVPHMGFALYKISATAMDNEPPPAEEQLARLVYDFIPRDIWDAGVAAIASGAEQGPAVAKEILEHWKKTGV